MLAAAGPGGALAYHATYELYGRDAVVDFPAGGGSRSSTGALERERHLAVHVGHCIHLDEADQAACAATGAAAAALDDGHRHRRRGPGPRRCARSARRAEVVFQPCRPDIRREFEAIFTAVSS